MTKATFDLAAYRAAKADTVEKREVAVGKRTYTLPHSVPLATIEAFSDGKIRAGLVSLGGEAFTAALFKEGLTADELGDLVKALYGESVPN